MALDAFVFCDCFERDNLRSNPPHGVRLKVAPNGDVTCDAPNNAAWHAFSTWKLRKACLHEGMIMVHHRLGNSGMIDLMRRELENQGKHFPLLLKRVLYSGTHTCDWIPLKMLPGVTEELKRLNPDPAHTPVADALRLFKIQIAELVIAAQLAGKPICF